MPQRIYSSFKPVVDEDHLSIPTAYCCEVTVNIQEETYRSGMKALSAKSMKPSKLIRHLNTKQPNHATRS